MKLRMVAVVALLVLLSVGTNCNRLDKGLEAEKSYSRYAMEYHREHPETRKGDARLELWSTADYVAKSVQEHDSGGSWAKWSDQIPYLAEAIKKFNGHPFCVIESPSQTVVLAFYVDSNLSSRTCTAAAVPPNAIAGIESGDMDSLESHKCMAYVLRRPIKR